MELEGEAELTIRCVEDPKVRVRLWDPVWLPGFFAGLAEELRGWEGVREWRTSHLGVEARFYSRGYVSVTWLLRPCMIRRDSWQVRVTTWLEAGSQMSALADRLGVFLPLPGPKR